MTKAQADKMRVEGRRLAAVAVRNGAGREAWEEWCPWDGVRRVGIVSGKNTRSLYDRAMATHKDRKNLYEQRPAQAYFNRKNSRVRKISHGPQGDTNFCG